MFKFTTTTILNSNTDKESGLTRVTSTAKDNVNILRVGTFKMDDVKSVVKRAYSAPAFAKITIDPTKATDATNTYRLNLYAKLSQHSWNSQFANDVTFRGKPLTMEFPGETTADTLIKKINDYLVFMFGSKVFKVSKDSSTVVVESLDPMVKFETAILQKWDSTITPGAVLNQAGDWATVANGVIINTASGEEGFGDYEWMLHNISLDTTPHRAAYPVNKGELPVYDGTYNQYTITMRKDRGILGGDAVGEVTTSETTHVFYVLTGAVSTAFEAALKSGLGIDTLAEIKKPKAANVEAKAAE